MRSTHFMEQMERGRDNAKRDRDRGGSSVKVYRTAAAMYAARGDRGEWERACEEAQSSFRSARADAIEQYRFDVHGEQWEGL